MWRAATNCLPTLSMLRQKHVPVQGNFTVCNGEDETLLHMLVTCPIAARIWCIVIPDVHQERGGDLFSWVQGVIDNISQERRATMAKTYRAIWKARNAKVWNGRKWFNEWCSCFNKTIPYTMENAQDRSCEALNQACRVGD